MATLICKATGNLTGAATFAVAEAGSGATNLIRFNHTGSVVAAGTQASVAFTINNGDVIDGVLLWVRQGAAGSTGTLKVALQKSGVDQASVTVNKTDLPDVTGVNNAPVFFRFTSTATGDGTATWTILLTTTGTNAVSYCTHASGATNITRALRTTTAQTPAAGDDLYITGELTGAGTHNAFVVTMNSTAATVYGNGAVNSTTVSGGTIAISNWGTLSYGNAASTNYILRVAGDIRVNQYGTLNIGSVGAEIPRSSTAVLEFQPVSVSGDFGLLAYDNAVINIAGLSRTSGKNVVKCKLTSDVVSSNVLNASVVNAMTSSAVQMDATGTSLLGGGANETTANSPHTFATSGPNVTNVTQTAVAWLAQGSGPSNNRYVRFELGNAPTLAAITNGFYSDLDLQAGTASAITNVGTGVGTGITIVAQGAGWLVKMTGKVATTAAVPSLHLAACSALGTVSYTGVASNQNFLYDHVALVNAGSVSDTTFNVDTDTGWLNGDVICVAATSRTYQETTLHVLDANAGSSSLVSPLYPINVQVTAAGLTFMHSGTAPWQAEIGLITRNVKVRSTSPTLVSYFYGAALATITTSWAEFYRMGTITTGKRGIELDCGAVANPKSFTYCSVHDFPNNGFFTGGNLASFNAIYSNNVNWFTGQSITVNGVVTNGDYTFDNNLVMRPTTYGFALGDVGGTVTNNTACACATQYGFSLAETSGVIGTFNNNLAHTCSFGGLTITAAGINGTIGNFTAWRMTGSNGGIDIVTDNPDLTIVNPTFFGNTPYNLVLTSGDLTIIGGTFGGDTLFSTANGISITGGSSRIRLDNVDMSGTGSGLAPHTGVDLFFVTAPAMSMVQANNCKWGAPNVFLKTNWSNGAYVGFEKYNGVAGDHRTEMKYGQLRTDSTYFNLASPSMRMTPINANNKLESAPRGRGIQVALNNGNTVTASAVLRKSTLVDGNYNGNQPRLIVRANAALGINSDTVLASDTSSLGLAPAYWDLATAAMFTLSGSNLVATQNGTAVDCGCKVVDGVGGKTAGKFYYELTLTTINSTLFNSCVGIGAQATSYSNLSNNATTGVVAFFQAGNIWANGVNTGSAIGARATGDVIGMAIDLDNRLAWFRVAPSGSWNGSGTANPATGAGGIAIPAGAMTVFMTGGGAAASIGNTITANFGTSTFVGAVPSGFTAGWSVNTFSGTWFTLSGTTAAVTDDGVLEFIVDVDGTTGFVNVDDWSFS